LGELAARLGKRKKKKNTSSGVMAVGGNHSGTRRASRKPLKDPSSCFVVGGGINNEGETQIKGAVEDIAEKTCTLVGMVFLGGGNASKTNRGGGKQVLER